jgi:phosphoribosylformylglycinamidine (FGAM) synthase-like amidotransferase family enzyme
MPKSPVAHGAGNVNMKGKKYKLMRCRCCVCIDFRDRELKKEHRKEINAFRKDEYVLADQKHS